MVIFALSFEISDTYLCCCCCCFSFTKYNGCSIDKISHIIDQFQCDWYAVCSMLFSSLAFVYFLAVVGVGWLVGWVVVIGWPEYNLDCFVCGISFCYPVSLSLVLLYIYCCTVILLSTVMRSSSNHVVYFRWSVQISISIPFLFCSQFRTVSFRQHTFQSVDDFLFVFMLRRSGDFPFYGFISLFYRSIFLQQWEILCCFGFFFLFGFFRLGWLFCSKLFSYTLSFSAFIFRERKWNALFFFLSVSLLGTFFVVVGILVIWKRVQSTEKSLLLIKSICFFFFFCFLFRMRWHLTLTKIPYIFFSHHRFYTHNNFSNELLLLNFSFDYTCYMALTYVSHRSFDFVRWCPIFFFFFFLYFSCFCVGMIWAIVSYTRCVKHIRSCPFEITTDWIKHNDLAHIQ